MPLPTDQFQVNLTNTSATQNSPHIGTLFDGRQVVVWKDLGVSNSAIKFKIYNADGTAATGELDVNPGQGGYVGLAGGDDYLSISGTTNGGFVVAWQQRALPTADENIFFRVFDAAGNGGSILSAHSDPNHTNANYTQGDQKSPDVTWTDSGFAIAWEDNNTVLAPGRSAIVVQNFDLNGVSQSLAVADTGTGNNGSVDLAYAAGKLNTTWAKFNSPNGAWGIENGGIGVYRADALSSDPVSHFSYDPSSAYGLNAAGTGLDFMSIWTQWSPTTGYEIRGSFNGDGANSFRINTVDTATSSPSENVVGLAGGGWLVVWTDGGSDNIGGTDCDVIGQYFNAAHQKVGSEFVITSDVVINNNLTSLDLDFLPQGGAMVTWEAGGPTTSGPEIYARYLPGLADTRTGPLIVGGLPGADYYYGTPFADDIRTGAGSDRLYGNGGDDYLQPGSGTDYVDGGDGFDMLSFYDLPAGVSVTLAESGSGTAATASGTVHYTGIENLAGSDAGAFGVDQITGADTLIGNSHDNLLLGFWGNDSLYGMGGNDILDGGLGNDLVDGGAGADTANLGSISTRSVKWGSTAADLTLKTDYGTDHLVNVEYAQFYDAPRLSTAGLVKVFAEPTVAVNSFGHANSAGGWSSDHIYHRELADVNGDGRADIVGFGGAGAFVALGAADGTFGNPFLASSAFGFDPSAGSWTDNGLFPRTLGDVNGDHRADIVGFGDAGVWVALARSDGTFTNAVLASNSFGHSNAAGGWSDDAIYHREVADVNGDGRGDIIGFGGAGTFIALATGGSSFGNAFLASNSFGFDPSAGSWGNNDLYPRTMADINGDHKADIIGFGSSGVYAALATGGGAFTNAYLALTSFGADNSAGGWSSNNQFHREMADVNGDQMADIVGFGGDGSYVALAIGGGGFTPPAFAIQSFGSSVNAGGWTNNDLYPRTVADVNGDGRAELVGFGETGVYTATYNDWFYPG